VVFQKDQAIRTNAKSSVAHKRDLFGIIFGEFLETIIDKDKIVARSLIFVEIGCH
jgi:hypothetical protein